MEDLERRFMVLSEGNTWMIVLPPHHPHALSPITPHRVKSPNSLDSTNRISFDLHFSCGRAALYQTFVFHYLQIMQALLILTISGVTSAAITIAEPHAFGLIHPPEVSGLFAHDYDKDGDGN